MTPATGIETIRLAFRPSRITTLFVGESAPASGNFFYCGKPAMTKHFQNAWEDSFGPIDNFLETFKAAGCFLDDLALTPVNKLPEGERKAKCLAARDSLARRIVDYRPQAIVSFARRVHADVRAAAVRAGSSARFHEVSFPGCGWQNEFRADMKAIMPSLPIL